MRRDFRLATTVVVLGSGFISSAPSWAHEGTGSTGGLLSGFIHPFSGWDHILAMVAVGMWGSQLGPPAIFLLPITFPLTMAFGGFIGLIGVPLPAAEIGIGASALVLGFAVAVEARPALWLSMAVVAVFAIFHGYAHGAELESGADALTYSLGFVIATGLLHAIGIAIGLIRNWRPGKKVIQGLGAVVAVAGVAFLVKAVTG